MFEVINDILNTHRIYAFQVLLKNKVKKNGNFKQFLNYELTSRNSYLLDLNKTLCISRYFYLPNL